MTKQRKHHFKTTTYLKNQTQLDRSRFFTFILLLLLVVGTFSFDNHTPCHCLAEFNQDILADLVRPTPRYLLRYPHPQWPLTEELWQRQLYNRLLAVPTISGHPRSAFSPVIPSIANQEMVTTEETVQALLLLSGT
jgi:hypothetical protein